MKNVFFIVGPTATGKSDLAAEVAAACGAEIVSIDAFQIYRGLDLLTGKPDAATRGKAPHHLIGSVSLGEEMNAAKFRALAEREVRAIHDRMRLAIVVGGSGLYVRAFTHGIATLPAAERKVRAELNTLSREDLHARLATLDPESARTIDRKNSRRLIRALEICLLTKGPVARQRRWETSSPKPSGVLLLRDRDDLYDRINRRVEIMFAQGVVQEVRAIEEVGATAARTLGFHEIRQLIAGEISQAECIGRIQQATRRYAKRQLTWFRHQTNFPSLNLSLQGRSEAIARILREARLAFAPRDD